MLAWVRKTMGQSRIEVFRMLLDGDERRAQAANETFEEAYRLLVDEGAVLPIPGAIEAIKALRHAGVKVALTTGFARATQEAIVSALGWWSEVDLVLSPADAGRGRPFPDLVLVAAHRLGVDDLTRVAVVGDTPLDLIAGKRAGAGLLIGVLTGAGDRPALRAAGATQVIGSLRIVVQQLSGATLPNVAAPWWLLVPLPGGRASYSAPVFLIALAGVVVLTVFVVHRLYHRRVRRAAPWDCGFGGLNARMQDTAEGFGQPIRHIFGALMAVKRELPSPFDPQPRYRVTVGDRLWQSLYVPLGGLVQRVADAFAWLQQGRIATYLLYSFVTLIVLLALML